MKGYVYILQSDDGKYYIGSTADLQTRLKRHLSGFVYTTRRMRNPKLILSQEFRSVLEAKKIEYKLKRLKRKDYIDKIIRDGKINMRP